MHLRHDWREVARVFNPPAENLRNMEAKGDPVTATAMMDKAVHGFTQVEYACRREGCTKRKIVEYSGRVPERVD